MLNFIGFNLTDFLWRLLFTIPCIIISMSFHEYAHAYVAYRLGDPTARNLGRMTLNPLKHIDPIGAICMLFFRFGWARPVPIRMRHFKKPRRDMALVSIAGPITNLILAFVGLLIFYILRAVAPLLPIIFTNETALNIFSTALTFFDYFCVLNISFAVFNLIPIPPLDGSRLLMLFLPPRAYIWVAKYERYTMIVFFLLLYTGILTLPLNYLVNAIFNGMSYLIALLPFL